MAPVSSWLTAVCLLSAAGCGAGQTVTLGGQPQPYHFGAAAIIPELAATTRSDNPTLTANLLEIYFTSVRDGNGDIWMARRAAATLPFETPVPVVEVNTPSFETSSAISADGLTLWFGSDRAGGAGLLDTWVSTRAGWGAPWSTPVNVLALGSPGDDIPRSPGQHGLVMPMSSSRVVTGLYWTYLAARPSPGAPFGAPVLVDELAYPDRSAVDAFLTDDGLTMFFSSAPASTVAGNSDLYVAWRPSAGEPFSVTQPLDDLNTAADERDPWLTADGKTLYFTSDRDGALSIYSALVLAP